MKTQLLPKRHPAFDGGNSASPTLADRVIALVIAMLVVACHARQCSAQSDDAATEKNKFVEPQLLQLRDPELLMPAPVRRLSDSYLPLWIEALSGPEYELKRDVAMSITRAHRDGYFDCSKSAVALKKILEDPAAPRSVLTEVARALITLDDRDSLPKLKELLRTGAGTQFEMIVEPALARWEDVDMLAIWQQRLTAKDVSRHRRLLAIRAINNLPDSMADDQSLIAALKSAVVQAPDISTLLEAAKTLGQVKQTDLESLAKEQLASTGALSLPERLSGVYLILQHESQSSQKLLLEVVTDALADPRQAPLIRVGWSRLLERGVTELSPLVFKAMAHGDPEIRRLAINTIVRFPTKEGIGLLGKALDDQHPEIRRTARQSLLELSKNDSLSPFVRQAGQAAIARSSWREQEQAVVLLTLLNQSGTADRMLELIDSPRAEVCIAAAWGLRNLNVAEKNATILKIAEAMDQQIQSGESLLLHQPTILAHLFEALGRAKYEPAIPLVKKWLPKTPPRVPYEEPRTSAFWAIGRLYEDSSNLAMSEQLKVRHLDIESFEPETASVRYEAAIAVGRIGAAQVAPDMRDFAELGGEEAALAGAWAIERLTGEVIPPPDPPINGGSPWKLVPIGSRRETDSAKASVR